MTKHAQPDLLQAAKVAISKLDGLTRRLVGRRPHPNDIEWAKTIVGDIDTILRAAIAKAEKK